MNIPGDFSSQPDDGRPLPPGEPHWSTIPAVHLPIRSPPPAVGAFPQLPRPVPKRPEHEDWRTANVKAPETNQ